MAYFCSILRRTNILKEQTRSCQILQGVVRSDVTGILSPRLIRLSVSALAYVCGETSSAQSWSRDRHDGKSYTLARISNLHRLVTCRAFWSDQLLCIRSSILKLKSLSKNVMVEPQEIMNSIHFMLLHPASYEHMQAENS